MIIFYGDGLAQDRHGFLETGDVVFGAAGKRQRIADLVLQAGPAVGVAVAASLAGQNPVHGNRFVEHCRFWRLRADHAEHPGLSGTGPEAGWLSRRERIVSARRPSCLNQRGAFQGRLR
ncbi:hypothetical protein ACFSQT_19340 [Mesorhizobium calcicola]|uniref:Uncharacterized protein n=1 Tax=Mesorhizobium calcicola TaxID=1300310 RepID=A0ABW4WHW3_9HYPH